MSKDHHTESNMKTLLRENSKEIHSIHGLRNVHEPDYGVSDSYRLRLYFMVLNGKRLHTGKIVVSVTGLYSCLSSLLVESSVHNGEKWLALDINFKFLSDNNYLLPINYLVLIFFILSRFKGSSSRILCVNLRI